MSVAGWSCILILTLIHILDLDGNSSTYRVKLRSKPPGATLPRNTIIPLFSSLRYSSLSFPALMTNLFNIGTSNTPKADPPSFYRTMYQLTSTTFLRIGPTLKVVQSLAAFEIAYVLGQQLRGPILTTTGAVFPAAGCTLRCDNAVPRGGSSINVFCLRATADVNIRFNQSPYTPLW